MTPETAVQVRARINAMIVAAQSLEKEAKALAADFRDHPDRNCFSYPILKQSGRVEFGSRVLQQNLKEAAECADWYAAGCPDDEQKAA